MAIIKHLKRLGATIRGAGKDELATFDKDGNVVGSNKYTKYVPTAPGNANVRKVWTAKTNASAGWENVPTELPEGESGDEGKILFLNDQLDPQWGPQYPTNGSEGDVLTLGENGPEWTTPGGGALYAHNISIQYTGSNGFTFSTTILSKSNTPFTPESFLAYLAEKHSTKQNAIPCSGAVKPDGITGVSIFAAAYTTSDSSYIYMVCGTFDYVNSQYSAGSTSVSKSNISSTTFNDRVVPIE